MERMEPLSQPAREPEAPKEITQEEARQLLHRARPGPPRRSSVLTTVLAALFLAGVAYGAALVRYLDADTVAAMDSITRGFLLGRAGEGFWGICLRALGSGAVLLAGVFLCGFSAVGQPFAVFFLLFRGVGLGISMGYFTARWAGGASSWPWGCCCPAGPWPDTRCCWPAGRR